MEEGRKVMENLVCFDFCWLGGVFLFVLVFLNPPVSPLKCTGRIAHLFNYLLHSAFGQNDQLPL